MIRVSATNLEAYRRWLLDDESDLEQIRDYLLRRTPPNKAMLAGSAFHKVLENANAGILEKVEQDGFIFDFKLDEELFLPKLKELKREQQLVINGEEVTFVGVVDAIHADEVFDHKLTSNDSVESYVDSMQWRFYLLLFNARKFTYNLFKKYESTVNEGHININSLTQVTFNTYPTLRNDVMVIASDYVDFIKKHIPEMVK